ncbi:MAG: aldo/keto reductase, partial [Nostocoides sp.]
SKTRPAAPRGDPPRPKPAPQPRLTPTTSRPPTEDSHERRSLVRETGVRPVVNQIQFSPLLARRPQRAYADTNHIALQAWGPLGQREDLMGEPVLAEVARDSGHSPAQVALRWIVQQGVAVLPKSADPDRQRANADLFAWSLTPDQKARLDSLDLGEDAAWDADVHEET